MSLVPERDAHLAEQFDDLDQQHRAEGFGMWVFLATEVMMFSALFLCYAVYRHEYFHAFLLGSSRQDRLRGGIDATLLLTSSLSMTFAIQSAQKKRRWRTFVFLLVAMGLGLAFLGIEASEYRAFFDQHLFPGGDFAVPGYHGAALQHIRLYFILYFTMVSLHGLHVAIGVILLGFLAVLNLVQVVPEHETPVEMIGLYWHFVDIVFQFLFPMFYLIMR